MTQNKSCILDLDSPSYPPEIDEYIQCSCVSCLEYLKNKAPYPFCSQYTICIKIGYCKRNPCCAD